ncbi:unnamed protein product [Leptidea sinapis]|uniref:PSD13 N-terminal domain-containing protein n=1 Tax=Leptidea sinapis TaxID=189913 RepID=A0A5E4QZB1_9NEOP|nr:unnamed protein product [Leptidea sinapis]
MMRHWHYVRCSKGRYILKNSRMWMLQRKLLRRLKTNLLMPMVSLQCMDDSTSWLQNTTDLPQAERRAFALHMALAAVVAPDVYDLGELLAHPIMENLNGTSDEWARELLKAVANGDVVAFENIRASTPHTELHRLDRVHPRNAS